MPSVEVWEDTFRVNNRTFADQDQPDIVGLSNGNFLVVWREDNDTTANGFGSDIMGQIYDPRGNEIGGEIFLNETYGSNRIESQPSVAATDDGGFVLTYLYPSGTQQDYLFRRFDADGVPDNTQNRYALNETSGSTFYSDLEVVHRPDGSSVVTYRRDLEADEDIVFKTISAAGTVGTESIVRSDDNPTGAINGDPDNPRAAVLTDGRVVVAYVEEDNNVYGVEFRIITTNNTIVGARQITNPNDGETNVEVAALTNGGFVITYLRDNIVYGQTFDSFGSPDSGEVALFSGSDTKTEPKVIGLKDGGFAVAFLDQTDGEVSVRAFDVNGDPTGSKADVPFEGGDTFGLEMSLTADGRILIAWTNSDNGDEDVFSAILDPRDDVINVDDGTVTVASQSGSTIRGSSADDVFYGVRGDDTLVGREGEDLLSGGLGKDRLDGGKNADLIFGKADADRIFGGKGGDDIFGGSGADKVYGGDWNDNIDGGRGNDTLLGEEGNDDMSGGNGNDNVNGGKGRDELAGGTGNDRIIGGKGTDEMRGGSGQDSFIFRTASDSRAGSTNRDTIEDYRTGIDTIDLGAIDADTTRSGNQAFEFIGAAGFSRDGGELRVQVNGQNAVIQGDRDGNGLADFEIRLEDFSGINTFDFIL